MYRTCKEQGGSIQDITIGAPYTIRSEYCVQKGTRNEAFEYKKRTVFNNMNITAELML